MEKQIRLVLIGFGGMGQGYAKMIAAGLAPELKLVGENVYGRAASGKEFCLIPYYKWCNRGEGEKDAEMTVWMKQENMRAPEELAARIGEKLYDIYE